MFYVDYFWVWVPRSHRLSDCFLALYQPGRQGRAGSKRTYVKAAPQAACFVSAAGVGDKAEAIVMAGTAVSTAPEPDPNSPAGNADPTPVAP